jgi:radical SAM protein with 4Fe4S-binding SPASM domain
MSCPHCFNAEMREDKTMDVDVLLRFIKENKHDLNHSVLKLMGGEPTIHPQIIEVIREACKYYLGVSLYTNGTKMNEIVSDPILVKNNFGGKLQYTINGFTFKVNDFLEYREFVKFINLHFVIPLNNHENVLEKMEKCMELAPKVTFIFSPNTQLDLINDKKVLKTYRKVWTETITHMVPMLTFSGIPYTYDHRFPMCFYNQEMLDKLHDANLNLIHRDTTGCCSEEYVGLIAYNYDIYYCNQTQIKLGSLLNEDGSVKSVQDLNYMIKEATKMKVEQIAELSNKCKNCAALSTCKVGCYYNTLVRNND